jgi:hypothetical protein
MPAGSFPADAIHSSVEAGMNNFAAAQIGTRVAAEADIGVGALAGWISVAVGAAVDN